MKNIRIGTKVVSVVVLLALIAVAAVGYAVHSMSDIGATYSALINGTAKETLAVARANRMVQATRADLFNILAETDDARLATLGTALDADKAKFHDYVDAAKAAVPEDTPKCRAGCVPGESRLRPSGRESN
jgi:methyl-accepting chemotaxis protein